MVEIYFQNNQFEEAEKELEKVQRSKGSMVQSEKLSTLWREKQTKDPKEIEKQVKEWEELLKEYPDYRDGYLELTLLYLKLGKTKKAKEALQKALELSPNYEKSKKLKESFFDPS